MDGGMDGWMDGHLYRHINSWMIYIYFIIFKKSASKWKVVLVVVYKVILVESVEFTNEDELRTWAKPKNW